MFIVMVFISIICLIIASVYSTKLVNNTNKIIPLTNHSTEEGWTALTSSPLSNSLDFSFPTKEEVYSPKILSRLTAIFLIYSAIISFNALYYDSLISGVGIYSGLFQITNISQSIEVFIYIIGAFILLP
jgi:hypothetical protein